MQRGLLTLFCLTPLLGAALPEYAAGILDVDTVLAAAAAVTAEEFPNADSVLVDDHIITAYQADGRAETYDDTFVKILTEKGRQDNRTLSRHFTLPYGEAAFRLVQVIRPDGTVIDVDVAAQSRVMVDRSQMGANIYDPNSKVLTVTIPELQVGDMVRYVAHTTLVKPRVPNTWSDYQVLEYTSPIRRLVYEIRGPRALPLRSIALKAEVPGTVSHTRTVEDDMEIHRWEVRDVPRMYREPSMPALHTVVQRLLVSTIPDWESISRWYWELSLPHLECTDAIRAKVRDLTAGLDDREARIRAIFKFVSQEIRYMGITVETEAPGYEPHDVSMTFENRHGVCRDKAALLVAMLREAGFKAYPVLIHNGPRKDVEVPQPFFNHAVSAVEHEDGSYQLMDATDENTKEMFPAYLSNQSYLVAKPEGAPLKVSALVPAEENMMHIETRCRLDEHGNLQGESSLRFDGINDNAYRGFFSRIEPAERRHYFEGVIKRVAAGARLTAITITPEDMLDTETPFAVELRFAADDVLISQGNTALLPVPRFDHNVGIVNFILGNTGLEKRRYPFVSSVACGVREKLVVELHPALGSVVSLPEFPQIEDQCVSWSRSLAGAGQTLMGQSEFQIKTTEFSPEQYLELKKTLATIEFNARKKPILHAAAQPHIQTIAQAPADDARILEETVHYQLDQDGIWSVKRSVVKEILSYKGKKENSELQLDFNPAWNTVELLSATVETNGVRKPISEEEINLMDAAWVAAAPRYPAAKTLVASLPGVEVGSIIRYEVLNTYRDRTIFTVNESFRGHDPIDRKTVFCRLPGGARVEIGRYQEGTLGESGTDGPIQERRRQEGNGLLLEWYAENQPSVRREKNLPPWWGFNPTVLLSHGTWKDYARQVREALLQAAENQPRAAALGRMLAAEGGDGDALLKRIRDHVSRNVRAAGPDFAELPLACITPADVTLVDGYGNSADRAVLLYAMLRGAGLAPEFVLPASGLRQKSLQETLRRHPDATPFRQVLVGLSSWRRRIYLNDTDEYAVIGVTRNDGAAGLWLRQARFRPIRAEHPDEHQATYRITLDDQGHAQIDCTQLHFGTFHAEKNRRFAEMPPEERNRYYQRILTDLSQAARPAGELQTEFATHPGREAFRANVEQFAVMDGPYCYFNLPRSLGNLLDLRTDQRHSPLYWASARRFRIVTDVVFPETYRQPVILPDELTWEAPGGGSVSVKVQQDVSDEQGRPVDVRIVYSVALAPAVIAPQQYGELLDINRKVSHAEASTLLLGQD